MPETKDNSFSRFLHSSRNLAISTMISRVLGLFRETMTAAVIGGGELMSGWVLALTCANFFRRILGEGELGKAVVPLISHTLTQEGRTRARERFSTILLWLTALLVLIALLIGIPSFLIGQYLKPGHWRTTFLILPILMPYTVFICVVGAATAYANALREFFLPSLTAILQNAVLIFALALLGTRFKGIPMLRALALSVLVAGVLEMGLIALILRKNGMMIRFSRSVIWDFKTIRTIWTMIVPGLLGAGAVQLSLICDRVVAGLIGSHAAASIYYSDRLVFLPIGIFAVSFATVSNTDLSRCAAMERYGDFTALITKTIRILLFVSLPFTAFMTSFPQEVIQLFYRYGAFDAEALRETAYAFTIYAVGIPTFSVYKISSVSFTARRDMRTPLRVSLLCISLNIVLNFAFMVPFRQGGIAAATILSSLLNNTLLLILYNRTVSDHPIGFRSLGVYLCKLVPACFVPLLPAVWVFRLVKDNPSVTIPFLRIPFSFQNLLLSLGIAGILYGAGLLLVSHLLHIEESEAVVKRFLCIGGKKKAV